MSGASIDVIGKSWPSTTYEVSREKIKEYVTVLGIDNPVHRDVDAAREAGFRDIVAPPMFAAVYVLPSMIPPMDDPDLAINFARAVHGGQTFEWGEPVCSGDLITTTPTLTSAEEKGGNEFYLFAIKSVNGVGTEVVRGTWTVIVRGA